MVIKKVRLWKITTNILLVLLIGIIAVEYPWIAVALLGFFMFSHYVKWMYGKNRRLRARIKAVEKQLKPLNKVAYELEQMRELFEKYLRDLNYQREHEQEESYQVVDDFFPERKDAVIEE